jgi:hypothetical protein
MQDAWKDFRAHLQDQLDTEKGILDDLRSRRVKLGRRAPGGDWEDTTDAEIGRSQHIVTVLEGVIAKIDRDHLRPPPTN